MAEKSNPSNMDCIQIEIFASNLSPKYTNLLLQTKKKATCTIFLDAAIQLRRSGFNMVSCIQSVSREINYYIRTTMNASINALMNNESFGCKQIGASHTVYKYWM